MKFLIVDMFHESLQQTLEENGHDCLNMSEQPVSEVMMAMPFADGVLLRSRISITADEIDRCPKLKVIGRVGAGLEHIDVEYAMARGIKVLSSPEGNRQAVAEHALGTLLALFNKISVSNAKIRSGKWERKGHEGIELGGKTVGIIGYGNTGSAFAKVLEGFDVKVLAFDKYKSGYAHEASMQQVFEISDVVSVHLPMSAETKYLVCSEWIQNFKKPIYLINTSRGGILNSSDLLNELNTGNVLGACLDVIEFESDTLKVPPFNELPTHAITLMNHEKVLITPHTAGLTSESYIKLSKILAQKILAEL